MTNRGPTQQPGNGDILDASSKLDRKSLPRVEASSVLEGAINPSAELSAARATAVVSPLNQRVEKFSNTAPSPEKSQKRDLQSSTTPAASRAVTRGASRSVAPKTTPVAVQTLRTRSRRMNSTVVRGAPETSGTNQQEESRSRGGSLRIQSAVGKGTERSVPPPAAALSSEHHERLAPPNLVVKLSAIRDLIHSLEQEIASPSTPESAIQAARAELPRLRALLEATIKELSGGKEMTPEPRLEPDSPEVGIPLESEPDRSPTAESKKDTILKRLRNGLLRLLGISVDDDLQQPSLAPTIALTEIAPNTKVTPKVQIQAQARTADITGQVVDRVTGQPIEGVTIFGGELGNATTDLKGQFTFPNVAIGTGYTIVAIKFDYEFEPNEISDIVTMQMEHHFYADHEV